MGKMQVVVVRMQVNYELLRKLINCFGRGKLYFPFVCSIICLRFNLSAVAGSMWIRTSEIF